MGVFSISSCYSDNGFSSVDFDLCLLQAAVLEVQKDTKKWLRPLRPTASVGFSSFLHLMTDSHGHCVTSKADGFKEKNPILWHCCIRGAEEYRLLHVILWFWNTSLHLLAAVLETKRIFCRATKTFSYINYFFKTQ